MSRISAMLMCLGLCLLSGISSRAQMGMNIFEKPTIASLFHPVVGGGAVYQDTRRSAPNDPPTTEELSIVAKDTVDGKEAYWMEVARAEKKGTMYAKVLITKDDFQFHRMVFQQPGQQATEMPFHPGQNAKDNTVAKNLDNWHQIGTESVTVPAGTFSCQHWKNDSGSEIWTSDQVTPFGAVKEVNASSSKVLLKVISDAQDHITGPLKQFDPQQMMQQMQKQRQSPN